PISRVKVNWYLDMYAAYSVLIVAFFVLVSPYLLYQAVRYRKYIGSLAQRMGYLPVSFNLDDDDDGAASGQNEPPVRRPGVLSAVRSGVYREPNAAARTAAAVRHDGNRD